MPRRSKPVPIVSFDVLSGLAQELEGPLQSLVKSSQKLLDDYRARDFEYISYKDFKTIIGTLEQINRQISRCSQTTQRLIRLAQPNGASRCHINEIITQTLKVLEQQLSLGKIKVVGNLGSNLPPVKMGPIECNQVIQNILANAIQAMPAGGKIYIRTKLDKVTGMVMVHIEDEGVGITPEHLSKVFEPFFTTKERGVEKNAGLGLSIVYSIVHALGGDIQIQSSLRRGTKVHIALPVAAL